MKTICENAPIGGDKVTLSVGFHPKRMELKYLLKSTFSRIGKSFNFECSSYTEASANLLEVLERYKTNTAEGERKLGWLFRVGNGIRDYRLLGHLPYEGEDAFYIYKVEKKHGDYAFLTDSECAITITFEALENLTIEVSSHAELATP